MFQAGEKQVFRGGQAENPGFAVPHQNIPDESAPDSQAQNGAEKIPMGEILSKTVGFRRDGHDPDRRIRRSERLFTAGGKDFTFRFFVAAGKEKGKTGRFPYQRECRKGH